jgi:hypothetical protein
MSVGFYITFIGLLTRRYIEQTPFLADVALKLDVELPVGQMLQRQEGILNSRKIYIAARMAHCRYLVLDAVEHAVEGLVASITGELSGQLVGLLVVGDGLHYNRK